MFGFLVFSVNLGWKYSIISGAVALTMFNIPILVRVIQQALEDVPQSQRDACLAMGLTRWEATIHVLIPAAMPAIVTGVVLSAGRVFGEAAALLFTSGMSSPVRLNFATLNFSSPTCAWNVFRPGESLAVHIYKIYGEGSPQAQEIVWGTAALLMICVLLFNISPASWARPARRMTSKTNETDQFLDSVATSEAGGAVAAVAAPLPARVILSARDVNVYYGDHHALHGTTLDFHKGEITALIGPSGCGKLDLPGEASTL